MKMQTVMALVAVMALSGGIASAGPAPDSKRLAQAKDYIADEQWTRAIAELKAAADDPREKNRDEALFWLLHSEHQSGDDASALQTIGRLEREFPASRWVSLAHSIRVEIAHRMQRDDVLWVIAQPPTPPAAPVAPGATPRPAVASIPPPRPGSVPTPVPPAVATPIAAAPPPPAPRGTPRRGAAPALPTAPAPPVAVFPAGAAEAWWAGTLPEPADQVVRIEALASLIDAHSDRVIPLLKDIALDKNSPDEARRAIVILAHSSRPEAHSIVLEVARAGAEPVQLAAIREMGRLQDANVSNALLQVYAASPTPRIRRQVVTSLGERADNMTLYRIAKTEQDAGVRNTAIMTLGRIAPARDQLRALYGLAPTESREAIINALFTAKDDDELIRIASSEKNPVFRQRARQQLRLLATPKAFKFLTDNP
ncbi:MAG TPA: HEAT repeat domain-containing protein [Vicinamibacterales bacterium]|nr:HEAT repeat domain-containing protein [Vicinamibacterales bacterium]